ncbi:MAG: hypothetical protein JWM11_5490 [Planctomycetaceae bacterium]|nr:hypothetical protein [Planctomycetaceae bacterium]
MSFLRDTMPVDRKLREGYLQPISPENWAVRPIFGPTLKVWQLGFVELEALKSLTPMIHRNIQARSASFEVVLFLLFAATNESFSILIPAIKRLVLNRARYLWHYVTTDPVSVGAGFLDGAPVCSVSK